MPKPPGLSGGGMPPIMSALANDMHQTVRAACLWLPDTEEFASHGSPNFRVRGKTFATYVVNHHGDGRVGLWLPAARGAQEHHLRADPDNFFVPPYVGPRGWVGVRLDRNLEWRRIAALVREAYEHVAPTALSARIGKAPAIKAPRPLSRSDIDPLESARGKRMIEIMRGICLKFPETREAAQFGHPVWQAGTRSFAMVRQDDERLTLCFWVGADRQNSDCRRALPHPAVLRPQRVDLARRLRAGDRDEIEALARQSYRHFALKRMLKKLSPDTEDMQ